MGYRIEQNEAFGAAFRRIVGEQSDKALAELAATDRPVEWRVHQLRKRCKKIRAVARLVRPGLDEYGQVNQAFRDTARLVSSHRDARVMAKLVRAMARSDETVLGRKPALSRVFRLQCAIAEQEAVPALAEAGRRMSEAVVGIERRALEGIDANAVEAGLEKTLGRAHEALAAVIEKGTSSTYHEWRKRSKYHWYHLRLLEDLAPEEMAERRSRFRQLGKTIGDAHDQSVLLERIECLPAYLRDAFSTRRFATLALRQRRAFRRDALELGAGLFDRPVAEVVGVYARHWQELGLTDAARAAGPRELGRRLSVA